MEYVEFFNAGSLEQKKENLTNAQAIKPVILDESVYSPTTFLYHSEV